MSCVKVMGKENLCFETNRGSRNKRSPLVIPSSIFSKSSKDQKRERKSKIAPGGWFPVYVGAERQRFVIKIECANHPLFRMLLEDAEMEYGYKCDGPLSLPCEVDLFYKVLAEMNAGDAKPNRRGSFGPDFGSLIRCPGKRKVSKGSSYSILRRTPSPLLKMKGV